MVPYGRQGAFCPLLRATADVVVAGRSVCPFRCSRRAWNEVCLTPVIPRIYAMWPAAGNTRFPCLQGAYFNGNVSPARADAGSARNIISHRLGSASIGGKRLFYERRSRLLNLALSPCAVARRPPVGSIGQ